MQHPQTQDPNSLEFKILRSTGNWEKQVGFTYKHCESTRRYGATWPMLFFPGTGKHTDIVDVQKVGYGIIGSFQSGV